MVDAVTLESVLSHIHNWFVRGTASVRGCAISGGELPEGVAGGILDGQWYRIEGSALNDGLHLHPDTELLDETFDGTISTLAIPRPLLALSEEIGEWIEDTKEADKAKRSAKYRSESFGGYSYSVGDDSRSGSGNGGLNGWKAAFAGDLNAWRKLA